MAARKSEKLAVLCVDDEKPIRELLEVSFTRRGHQVETCCNATEAIEILAEKDFDAMVIDLVLPGMKGIELCEKVRKSNPCMFILAITGYPTKYEFSDCRVAGFDGYFTKPLEFQSLVQAIEEGCALRKKIPEEKAVLR